jgi:phytoene desaturase
MYALAEAMLRLAAELGVELRTCAPVAEVEHAGGTVRGVRLEGGERLPAAQVLINADPRYAYGALVPGQAATAARLARL